MNDVVEAASDTVMPAVMSPSAERTRERRAALPRRAAGPVLVGIAAAAAMMSLLAGVATAAVTPWRVLGPPWPGEKLVYDVAATAPSFVAVAGAGGHVAVSTTAGLGWTDRSPASQGVTADLFGIAYRDPDHGVVVGAGGTMLVTSDGGLNWRTTGFSGARPTVDLHDVALCGMNGIAVGDGGVVIESSDGGESWRSVSKPTIADLRYVALAGDGTRAIGAANGTVFMRRGGTTGYRAANLGAITAVAIAGTPSWGDGAPDVVASTGWAVDGSDNAVTMTPLLTNVYAAAPPWTAVAWSGVPAGELLLSGATGGTSFYSVAAGTWTNADSGLGDVRVAAALGDQSVAYLLDANGGLARTLSAGREPATLTASAKTITAGKQVTLTATALVAAPGTLTLEHRVPGGVWKTAGQTAWTTADWGRQAGFDLNPRLTDDFRLAFSYGGGSVIVSAARRVVVRPRLTPDKLNVSVSRGVAYRFKGTVYPTLRGQEVEFYTDRGGRWHKLSIGGAVKLRDGTRWISRLFGTPQREKYHLRAHMDATTRHGSAWSPVVTVTVR